MDVSSKYERLNTSEVMSLLSGDKTVSVRLGVPCALAGATTFTYPGKGPLVLFLESDGNRIRVTDGGRLVKYLESQGQDLAVDPVLSRTVFHAVREVTGMGMGNGTVFLETSVGEVPETLPRFVQAIIEIIGLRHSKYKDALVQLSQRRDEANADPWGEQ